MTCLQSSDSWPKNANRHQLDGIANRYSILKMDDRSISGLKLALIDPDIRVRLKDDHMPSPDSVILGVWVSGGFLDAQTMRFSDGVNCFIGDTGSGKSLALELIRFGLDQQPLVPKILEEVESLLQQQLGELGTVHILLAKGGAQYLVERTWGSTPQKPLVQRVTEDGMQPIDEFDMRIFFPIKAFSQSEIIEFAREPDVRLSLTDDLIDCTEELGNIKDLKISLRTNAGAILAEQAKETSIREDLAGRAILVEDVARIDAILDDECIAQQQLWYEEEIALSKAKQDLDELPKGLTEAVSNLDVGPTWPDHLDHSPNQDILAKAKSAFQEWQKHVECMRAGAQVQLTILVESFTAARQEWNARFAVAEANYRQLLETLDSDGVGLQALSERRRRSQERISALYQFVVKRP